MVEGFVKEYLCTLFVSDPVKAEGAIVAAIVVGVGEAWDFLLFFVIDRAEVAPTSPGLVTENTRELCFKNRPVRGRYVESLYGLNFNVNRAAI